MPFRHPALLLLCTGALAAPIHAFAAGPYILDGDQTPPVGHEYTSPQPAIATASSTCPDWSCGSDRSADNAIDGVQDFGWNAGYGGPAWIAVIFDGARAMSGVHIDGEVQPYPGLTVAQAPTVTQDYSLDVLTTDGVHHTFGETLTMARHDTVPGYLTVNGHDFEFGQALDVASIRITVTNTESFPYDSWIAVDNLTLITAIADVDIDGDGVDDGDDACPDEDAFGWDLDADGCLDDSDEDGVTDDVDAFPDCDDLGEDTDGDLTPDECDVCPGDAENDSDGDALCAYDVDGTPIDDCPYDNDDDGNDLDGDTVCNSADVCNDTTEAWLGGSMDDLWDRDEDGIADGCDLCVDADDDGICTSEDICYYAGHGGDADVDGVCDDTDDCPLDYLDDADGDGSCDSDDICPGFDDTTDGDADSAPDCLDRCPADPENDADGDGLCESDDNCEGAANADQADTDEDGIGDACELDSDGDGVLDDDDVCAFVADSAQADTDGDGQGDACDTDDDGDNVADGRDRCPGTPAGTPVLRNGCSAAQTCPTTARWKNHGDYVSCVADVAGDLYRARAITLRDGLALIAAAADSNIGKHRKDRDRDHRRHDHDRDDYCRD